MGLQWPEAMEASPRSRSRFWCRLSIHLESAATSSFVLWVLVTILIFSSSRLLPSFILMMGDSESEILVCGLDNNLTKRRYALGHNWTDDELFARAGKTATTHFEGEPGLPPSQIRSAGDRQSCSGGSGGEEHQAEFVSPKIAFMFLTTGPLFLAPVWDAFLQGHEHLCNIYVHSSLPFESSLSKTSSRHLWGRGIPSNATERATSSLIQAERRLLAVALLDDSLNEYFALLSESCSPLYGFRHIYNTLTASNRSFVEMSHASTRMRLQRWRNRGGALTMGPEVKFSHFAMGSQFFVLTRRHALFFVRDRKYWNKFRPPCVVNPHKCYPEEQYFPTALNIEDPEGFTGYTVTSVNWSLGANQEQLLKRLNGHPRTYQREEVSKDLIASLRGPEGSHFLFARKFANDTADCLLAISDFLLRE